MSEVELFKSIMVSASGLRAQSERMRVIAENLANSDTLPQSPNENHIHNSILTLRMGS